MWPAEAEAEGLISQGLAMLGPGQLSSCEDESSSVG